MSKDLGNTSDPMLVPSYLLKRYFELLDWYDKEWDPVFTKMMPKTIAPGRGSKAFWNRMRGADPQGMAKFYGDDEAIEPMNFPHVLPWSYRTRKLGNAFTRTKKFFKEDFAENVIDKAHAEQMENLVMFINRSIEFILTKFAYADTTTMNRFTNQDTNRQGVVTLNNGQFNGGGASELGGVSWSDFSSGTPPIFSDLAFLKERFKYLAGVPPTYLIIGRKTEYFLEINDDILDRLIRLRDTTQGVLGDYLEGIQLIKASPTYKEIPGEDDTLEGMPGKGDYLALDWSRLNRKDMMTHKIGADTYEWSILGAENVGEVKCGWVDEDHRAQRGSPVDIFVEQWEERNPKHVWTTAQLSICPEVKDYARMMLIKGVAKQ